MCRLYGFCATEPTKVECTLVHAQNALLAQSESDVSGKSHSEGWGLATFSNGNPTIERQAWAAYHGEHFKRAAAKIYAKTVLAHVRRATVGQPSLQNTHPFSFGKWVFAHNGTIPNFKQLRSALLQKTSAKHRASIMGQTDSEHVFAFIRTLMDNHTALPITDILRLAATTIENLVLDYDANAKLGLNIMLTDGSALWGTRLGRTLFYVQRPGIYDCQICRFPHAHHKPTTQYRATVIASEPITDEPWQTMPNRSVWSAVPADNDLCIQKI